MNQMADAAVLQSVHGIYIFIYRPYCLKRKTKILKIILFFRSSEPFYGCTYYKNKQTNKKVYLQIAATYSLLPMPLKYLRLYCSLCFSLDSIQLFTPGHRWSFWSSFLYYLLPEWVVIYLIMFSAVRGI